MKNVKLVVFDIAGTTVRDNGNVAVYFIKAFSDHGFEVNTGEVNKVMGYRKKEAIETLLDNRGIKNDMLTEKIHDTFTSAMVEFYENDPSTVPLPGAEEIFELLRKNEVKVGLNTGFTKPITDAILKKLKWNNAGKIDFAISSDEVEEGRPSPLMIMNIMNELKISDAGQVVKVGDTEVDIREGRNAGCGMVIGITTGAFTRGELEPFEPDHIINNLSELPSLLNII